MLKSQLSQKNLEFERISVEKTSLERQWMKERDEAEHTKRHLESELSQNRDQLLKLTEKLANAEANLASTENNSRLTRNNIDERQRQIDELRERLSSQNAELNKNLREYEAEKKEKEKLLKRIEQMERTIEKNLKDAESNPLIEHIRSENQRLKSQVEDLSERLERTQIDLESAIRNSGGQETNQSSNSPRKHNVVNHMTKSSLPNKNDSGSNDAIKVKKKNNNKN